MFWLILYVVYIQ